MRQTCGACFCAETAIIEMHTEPAGRSSVKRIHQNRLTDVPLSEVSISGEIPNVCRSLPHPFQTQPAI